MSFRYCCIKSLSRKIVYTGAAQRDVRLASLRTQETAFVFVKDSLHVLEMNRLKYMSFEKKRNGRSGVKVFDVYGRDSEK